MLERAIRVLVTGGAGFIGSALIRHLLAHTEWVVLNADALTYAGTQVDVEGAETSGRYHFRKVDICDTDAISSLISAFQPAAVIHLAAETHVDRSIEHSDAFVHSNLIGTHSLLKALTSYWRALSEGDKRSFRLLHVSTDEVFGSLGETGNFSEASRYDPKSPYSASKAGSDHLVRAWQNSYGLPAIVSSCSNNYGPFQHPEKLVPLAITRCIANRPVPLFGSGLNIRDWIHVDDHVDALKQILERGALGQSYMVGGRCERTNLEIVTLICDLVDEAIPPVDGLPRRTFIELVDDRPGHDYRYAVEPSKIETSLGWRPATQLADGMARTVRWYIDNPQWWAPLVSCASAERGA